MKYLPLILSVAALWTAGCAKEDTPTVPPQADELVAVDFSVQARLEQESVLEPMTRATDWENWMDNAYNILVLKRIESKWIVDTLLTPLLDTSQEAWVRDIEVGKALPENSFSVELRPGAYRAVAVLNPQRAEWNKALVPGTVVDDDNDPSLPTPPLAIYRVAPNNMNKGYRYLDREIFVAVADFTVPKSSDLHSGGMPPVTLTAERRVGKFRMLLKDKPSPTQGYPFENTPHAGRFVFTSKGKPFPEGIDALGEMYYDPEAPLQQLKWCVSTIGRSHPSGAYKYYMSQTNSTVFAPFVFADKKQGDLPIEVSVVNITGAAIGYTYLTDLVFDRTLAPSKIFGIVFETTDHLIEQTNDQKIVEVKEARNDEGELEDAARLFDAFYEWNM